MNVNRPQLLWILILVLVAQGTTPGVVLCFEAGGRVELEVVKADCCDDDGARSKSEGLPGSIVPVKGEPVGSCGPCTDTPVSHPNLTRPARDTEWRAASPGPCAAVFVAPQIHRVRFSATVHPTVSSFIPITTTTLLI
jgi:hypothetical protein